MKPTFAHPGPVPVLPPTAPTYPCLRPDKKARATLLGCLAGIELQHGHHAVAERLAWQAALLREGCE